MAILDELRKINGEINELRKKKTAIVNRAIKAGVNWKELAYIDKIEAIKLCRDQENLPSLRAAIARVDEYHCIAEKDAYYGDGV